tara:strand:- start:192 stop:3971 length:3780 start_codon:yes stop_codon:yes gene_type:complete
MALFNKSFPNLLNGVSQQSDALRVDNTCKQQTNAYPSPVEGLIKRHPTDFRWRESTTLNTYLGGAHHVINRDDQEKYLVSILKYGASPSVAFTVHDLENGYRAGVNTADVGNYLSADNPTTAFKFVTIGDATIIVNKEKTVNMDSTETDALPEHAIVHVRQGDYDTDYKVTINGTTKSITTSATLSAQVQTDYIADALATELRGNAESWYQDNSVILNGVSDNNKAGTNDISFDGSVYQSAAKLKFTVDVTGGDTWTDKYVVDKAVRFTSLGTSTASNFMYNPNQTISSSSKNNNKSFAAYVTYYIESTDASNKQITLKTRKTGGSIMYAPHKSYTVDTTKDGRGTATLQVEQTGSTAFPNMVFTAKDSTILCESTEPFTIEANDSVSDTFIKAFHKKTQYFSELPASCYDGFKIKISGDAESIVDDYYATFRTREDTEYGEGTWVEDVGDEIPYKYDYSTMPVVLIRQSDGTFQLRKLDGEFPRFIDWKDKVLAGESATNAIRGIENENAAVGDFIDSGQMTANATHTGGEGTQATGSIRVDSAPDNDDTIVLTDYEGYAYTLKFHGSTTGTFADGRYVTNAGGDNAVAAAIRTAIVEAGLNFTSSVSTDTVSLTASLHGTAGNQTITQTGGTHHTIAGMTGGADFYSTVALENMTAGRVITAGTLVSKNPNTTTSHPSVDLNFDQDGWAGSPRYTYKVFEDATVASDGTVTVKIEGDVTQSGGRRTGDWNDNDVISFYKAPDFSTYTWNERKAGDENTNPNPSFVEKEIEDVFFFENRLGFVAGGSVCLSESGEFFNFFKVTVLQLLDTAPIDVNVPSTNVAKLRHGVPFKANLILFDEQTQYVLGAGRQAVTPKTVAISQTGTAECDRNCKPAVLGSNLMFPHRKGTKAGFHNMLIENPEADIYSSYNIAEHIPSYLEGNIKQLAVIPQENLLVVLPKPTAGTQHNTLYFYKYLDMNRKRVQSAWFKYEVTLPYVGTGTTNGVSNATAQIDSIHVVDDTLYMTCMPTKSGVNWNGWDCLSMKIGSNITDDNSSVLTLLDCKVSSGGAVNKDHTGIFNEVRVHYDSSSNKTWFDLPYYVGTNDNFKVYSKATDSSTSISEVTPESSNTVVATGTRVIFAGNVSATQYWFGKQYTMTYEFAQPLFKGATASGGSSLVTSGRYQVHSADLVYTDTNTFTTSVSAAGRNTYTYTFTADSNKAGITTQGTTPIDSGDFRVPIHAKNDSYTMTVTSTASYPVKLSSAEFEGQFNAKSRRAGV